MPIAEFRRHFSDLYAVANLTNVDRTGVVFTKRQRERAAKYFFDYAHCLNHLHHDRVITALRKGLITGAPYTEADVLNSLIIFGPCPACSKCKGTRHRQVGHYPVMPKSRPVHHHGYPIFRHQLQTNQAEMRDQAAE